MSTPHLNHGHTFLWHDYETFGAVPRYDRPAQFAAVRTDAQLNIVGEPVTLYCRPSPDYLPDPQSCLITGITPQHCLEYGLPEHAFAQRIEQLFSQPDTIGVGYNTLRFDDEFTRYLFWRNLIDPYAREWQNGCGRWDLLDVMRLAYALRPEGIQWPTHEDGSPSFKLEHLAQANHLEHEHAHDALSDVYATIALARLLKQHQPKLFDFALKLRDKKNVAAELGWPVDRTLARPFLHVSGMLDAQRGCLAVMWPLATHPTNRNEVIAWDLSHDPLELTDLSVEEVRQRLFTPKSEMPQGMTRLPIKTIHLNKSPMVVSNCNTLRPDLAQRWGIDFEVIRQHTERARTLPDLSHLWHEVFQRPDSTAQDNDVDVSLYAGFIHPADRRRLQHLRSLTPQELAVDRTGFDDARLPELVFRYRARNFPDTLSAAEQQRWHTHCTQRLLQGGPGLRTISQLSNALDDLAETWTEQTPETQEREQTILEELYDYAHSLVPDNVTP